MSTYGWNLIGNQLYLPIWLTTWHFNRSVALLFSLLCALVWFADEFLKKWKQTSS